MSYLPTCKWSHLHGHVFNFIFPLFTHKMFYPCSYLYRCKNFAVVSTHKILHLCSFLYISLFLQGEAGGGQKTTVNLPLIPATNSLIVLISCTDFHLHLFLCPSLHSSLISLFSFFPTPIHLCLPLHCLSFHLSLQQVFNASTSPIVQVHSSLHFLCNPYNIILIPMQILRKDGVKYS